MASFWDLYMRNLLKILFQCQPFCNLEFILQGKIRFGMYCFLFLVRLLFLFCFYSRLLQCVYIALHFLASLQIPDLGSLEDAHSTRFFGTYTQAKRVVDRSTGVALLFCLA